MNACDALYAMSWILGVPVLFDRLVRAVGDENALVRRSACEVLGKMSWREVTPEVVKSLVRGA